MLSSWFQKNPKQINEKTFKELISILSSGDRLEQQKAAQELGKRKAKIAVSALVKTLLDFEIDLWVSIDSATALGQIADPQAVEPLKEVLFSEVLNSMIVKAEEEFNRGRQSKDRYAYANLYVSYEIDIFRGEILNALKSIGTDEALKVIEEWETKHPNWKS